MHDIVYLSERSAGDGGLESIRITLDRPARLPDRQCSVGNRVATILHDFRNDEGADIPGVRAAENQVPDTNRTGESPLCVDAVVRLLINGEQDGPNIRPKQLRNREVPREGSHRSTLTSRRTDLSGLGSRERNSAEPKARRAERAGGERVQDHYKADGTGKLAPRSKARRSAPEINGPVAQQEFTSLLREACSPAPSVTAGAAVRKGWRAGTGVSRGRITESNEPGKRPGRSHDSGRAEPGRQSRPSEVLTRRNEAGWPSGGQRSSRQRKSGCFVRKDCQEPPDADPHVRWCGSREGQPSRRPDSADILQPFSKLVWLHVNILEDFAQ